MKKYFDILGLPEGASQEAIQEAYDRLSKELDPLNNNNQEFFVEEYEKLQEAYKALSNSTILKSSEKSYINSNVEKDAQEAHAKPNNDSITITFSPNKIDELKRKSQDELNSIHKYKPLMFINLFSSEGRIRRLEYCLSFIIYFIYCACCVALSNIANYEVQTSSLLLIPGYIFLFSQGSKRCHDLDKNGFWQIIPFYGLWLIFQEGKHGYNRFGPNPKGNN